MKYVHSTCEKTSRNCQICQILLTDFQLIHEKHMNHSRENSNRDQTSVILERKANLSNKLLECVLWLLREDNLFSFGDVTYCVFCCVGAPSLKYKYILKRNVLVFFSHDLHYFVLIQSWKLLTISCE